MSEAFNYFYNKLSVQVGFHRLEREELLQWWDKNRSKHSAIEDLVILYLLEHPI